MIQSGSWWFNKFAYLVGAACINFIMLLPEIKVPVE
jgi:hypothetical protein